MKLLSAYGANFSVQDEDGNTALHLAASAGHIDTCIFLAQRGNNMVVIIWLSADISLGDGQRKMVV